MSAIGGDGFTPNNVGGNSNNNQNIGGNGNTTGVRKDAWNQPIKEPVAKQNNNNDPNNPGGNDTGINDDDIENIWSDIKKKVPDNQQQQNNQQQTQNNNQQQQQIDPKKQLQDYLKEAGLGEFTLTDADRTELGEGKTAGLEGKILSLVQQAHVKALSGASTLIDNKVKNAVAEAINGTKGYIAGQEAVRALNTALPFTKDPTIGPVAQTVMQRFLDRGANQEDAIEGVKRWSKKFVSLADPDRQVNGNRNGNFRGVGSESQGTDWVSLLSPKS